MGIGTATDVHGLGLLLYELLTGRRAFEIDGLSPREVSRVVCDEPVPGTPRREPRLFSSGRSRWRRVADRLGVL